MSWRRYTAPYNQPQAASLASTTFPHPERQQPVHGLSPALYASTGGPLPIMVSLEALAAAKKKAEARP